MLESLFNNIAGLFKNTYFEEHLQTATSEELRFHKRKNLLIEFIYFYYQVSVTVFLRIVISCSTSIYFKVTLK